MNQPATALYQDRWDAGHDLAQKLLSYSERSDAIILSVSRGGALIGEGLADVLKLPLDVFFVRRVGVPGYEDLSMGIVARDAFVADSGVLERAGIAYETFLTEASAIQDALEGLESYDRDGRPPPELTGRTIILVDDGFAAHSDMPDAIEALHRHRVARVVAAVPVATPEARDALVKHDATLTFAHAIDARTGLEPWYSDATDVDDDAVRAALRRAAERLASD